MTQTIENETLPNLGVVLIQWEATQAVPFDELVQLIKEHHEKCTENYTEYVETQRKSSKGHVIEVKTYWETEFSTKTTSVDIA